MTSKSQKIETVAHLVEAFARIALAQDEASLVSDTRKYNKLYAEMEEVRSKLKSIKGDQRGALAPLLDHPNPQVRLKAAITMLAIAPEAARRTLQIISDRDEYPQAADARGMMRALDEGSYVPS